MSNDQELYTHQSRSDMNAGDVHKRHIVHVFGRDRAVQPDLTQRTCNHCVATYTQRRHAGLQYDRNSSEELFLLSALPHIW
jgi:hypothetical protein